MAIRLYVVLALSLGWQLSNAQILFKKEITGLKDSLKIYSLKIDSINAENIRKDSIISSLNTCLQVSRDSVASLSPSSLRKEIALLKQTNSQLQALSASKDADVNKAQDYIRRYANGRLFSPYDEAIVNRAIEALKLYKDKNDNRYIQIEKLLRSYKDVNSDLLKFFTSVDEEISKLPEFLGREDCQKHITQWKSRLAQIKYYREYYSNRNKNIYTINYMDRMIDCFLAEINRHSPDNRARMTTIITLMKE